MRKSKNPKADGALREVIDAAFAEFSREEELKIRLETLRKEFECDRSTALLAFEAVRTIAAYEWERNDDLERIPASMVAVPWWAIQALAIGFGKYGDARAGGRITPLGEAYGIEGGGQGKNTRFTRWIKEQRDRRIAMGIALRVSQGLTIEAAINGMINENLTSLSFERVEKIWAKHSKRARAMKFD
jgi:hypothetical protein